MDKINHSIHSHHMQESVWLISDKKQKQTLTSACSRPPLWQLWNNSRLISYHVPKRAQVAQPKTLKPFARRMLGCLLTSANFWTAWNEYRSWEQDTLGCQETSPGCFSNAGEVVRGLSDRNLLTGSPHNTCRNICKVYCADVIFSLSH